LKAVIEGWSVIYFCRAVGFLRRVFRKATDTPRKDFKPATIS
jgi:hypothetical protein